MQRDRTGDKRKIRDSGEVEISSRGKEEARQEVVARTTEEGRSPRQAKEDSQLMDGQAALAIAEEVRAIQDTERTPRILSDRIY